MTAEVTLYYKFFWWVWSRKTIVENGYPRRFSIPDSLMSITSMFQRFEVHTDRLRTKISRPGEPSVLLKDNNSYKEVEMQRGKEVVIFEVSHVS